MLESHFGGADRLFPKVGSRPYAEAASQGGAIAAQRLVMLSCEGSALGTFWFSRLRGALTIMRAMMRLHRMAVEAELTSRAARADFLWQEFDRAQARVLPHHWQTLWSGLANGQPEERLDGTRVRDRFFAEWVADIHLALCNGRVSGEALRLDARGLLHLRRARSCLMSVVIVSEQRELALEALDVVLIESERDVGRHDVAMRLAQEKLDSRPSSVDRQDRVVGLLFGLAAASLSPSQSEYQNRIDAETLQRSIEHMENFRQRFPYNISVHQALGQLHHLRAVKLANGGLPSKALLAIEKAIAFAPGEEKFSESRQKVREMIARVQRIAKDLDRQLAAKPGARLSPEGEQLLVEARGGTAPAEQFAASGEVEHIRESTARAQLRDVWLTIGLPPVEPSEKWDALSLALMAALNGIVKEAPPDAAALEQAWAALVARDSSLRDVDGAAVMIFLKQRLLKEADAPAANAYVPVAEVRPAKRRGTVIPLSYWLAGPVDVLPKLAAVAAAVLFSVGAWHLHQLERVSAAEQARADQAAYDETNFVAARDAEYARVLERRRARDDTGLMEPATTFLAAAKPNDPRGSQVAGFLADAVFCQMLQFSQAGEPEKAKRLYQQYQRAAGRFAGPAAPPAPALSTVSAGLDERP